MIDREHWLEAQHEEADWWGNCANTFHEEEKQMVYAQHMGIGFYGDSHSPYNIRGAGKVLLDIGGGPSSLLLKVKDAEHKTVVDPCHYPKWVETRYRNCGIQFIQKPAEDIFVNHFYADEVWIYNVLQHTEDPQKIIQNALDIVKDSDGTFRIFEWVDTPVDSAHPHCLTEDKLNEWLGYEGVVRQLGSKGCYGKAYTNIITL